MKRKGSKPPKERKKQPHEVLSLMAAWHSAVSSFLDSRACLVPGDEMFVLLEEASAACALGMLSVGFSRYACTPRLHAEELPKKILLSIKGLLVNEACGWCGFPVFNFWKSQRQLLGIES